MAATPKLKGRSKPKHKRLGLHEFAELLAKQDLAQLDNATLAAAFRFHRYKKANGERIEARDVSFSRHHAAQIKAYAHKAGRANQTLDDVRLRVMQLVTDGVSVTEATERLNREGYRDRNGRVFYTQAVMQRMAKARKALAAQAADAVNKATAPTPPPRKVKAPAKAEKRARAAHPWAPSLNVKQLSLFAEASGLTAFERDTMVALLRKLTAGKPAPRTRTVVRRK